MAGSAEAAEVSIRVEGAARTLLETRVDSTVHPVDGGDGSGQHPCRGAIGEPAGPTATGALDEAARSAGLRWKGEWSSSSGDFLVTEIAGESARTSGPWTILLNGSPTPVGGCSTKVTAGDEVLFARDVVFRAMTLGLSGPATVEPGGRFGLLVEDRRNNGVPVTGAEVRSGDSAAPTGADGRATFMIEDPGRYAFKATHPDGIRSNAVEVCVGVGGCVDRPGPMVRILGLADRARFMRSASPRSLRGTGPVDTTVRLALKFRGYGGRCRAWAGARKRLTPTRCNAGPKWLEVTPDDRGWALPVGDLPPGRYRLFARSSNTKGEPWRGGVNRIDFRVLGRRLDLRLLLRRSIRFLDRQTRRRSIRASGLLAGWTGLALGVRGRRSARRLIAWLRVRRPARATDADLARRLAALVRIDGGRSAPAMRAELAGRQSADGSFNGDLNLTAMSALALPDSVEAIRAAVWLSAQQQADGGFSAGRAGSADVDTTGLVAWALASNGFDEEVARAAGFIRSAQNPDGGLPAVPGAASNAQSTGLGLLTIHLAGGPKLGPRTEDGITPVHFLASVQRRSGSIDYMSGLPASPVWVISQALLGLTSRTKVIRVGSACLSDQGIRLKSGADAQRCG